MNTIFFAAIVAGFVPSTLPPITVNFSGEITSVQDSLGQLDPSIVIGTPFSGSYTFDPKLAIDTDPDPRYAIYNFDMPLSVQVGDALFQSPAHEVHVLSAGAIAPGQGYGSVARSFVSEGILIDNMYIWVGTSEMDVFEDDSLPLSVDIEDFELIRQFKLEGDSLRVIGELQSLVFVPEPASVASLILGVLWIAIRRQPAGD